jgi:hypothetical protein
MIVPHLHFQYEMNRAGISQSLSFYGTKTDGLREIIITITVKILHV